MKDPQNYSAVCCDFYGYPLKYFFFLFLLLALTFKCHSKAKAEVQSLFFSNITTNKKGNLSNE